MVVLPVLLQGCEVQMSRRFFALIAMWGLLLLGIGAESPAQQKGAAPGPAARPAPQADAELDRVLTNWYAASKDIKKLEGKHQRFAYDYTFGVCKLAEGEFYYLAPDKGRIDLEATRIDPKQKTVSKVSAIDGKQLEFTVEADAPERWICDGKQILQIHDAQKEVMQFEIPKEGQGQNIMDGPLPFLFGMPPDKAKQRYKMQLVTSNATGYVLRVLPRWQQDAANYKWAVVMLDAKTMLPMAVQLIDPSETTETVYKFLNTEKNGSGGIARFLRVPGSDPFKPNLKGYKFMTAAELENAKSKATAKTEPEPKKPAAQPTGAVVPSVIGLDHEKATEILQKSGYQVKLYKGDPAEGPQLTHHAYKQDPPAKSPLAKGEIVKVVLFTEPAIAQTQGQKGAPSGVVPNVVGLNFEVAKTRLEKAGYRVKFFPGDRAASEAEVHEVQAQAPKAGTKADADTVISLKLYIDEADVKKARGEK